MPADDRPKLLAMHITRSKIFGLVIALGYLSTAIVVAGWDTTGVAVVCTCLLLPLALIWFPDEIAERTRIAAKRGSRFNTETPASMVTLTGWLFLVGYFPLLAYLLAH